MIIPPWAPGFAVPNLPAPSFSPILLTGVLTADTSGEEASLTAKKVLKSWGKYGEKERDLVKSHSMSSPSMAEAAWSIKILQGTSRSPTSFWRCHAILQLAGGAEPCLLGKAATSGVTPVGVPQFTLVVGKGIWILWFGPEGRIALWSAGLLD